jgi:hypothetical protein
MEEGMEKAAEETVATSKTSETIRAKKGIHVSGG